MKRRERPWIVQLTQLTLTDGIKKVTAPEQIVSDITDPAEVGSVLLDGYIAEHAGETVGLDELRAWVWHPADHAKGDPPLTTVGPHKTTYSWSVVSRRRQVSTTQLIAQARTLDPRLVLPDGSGVTADGYAWLMLVAVPD